MPLVLADYIHEDYLCDMRVVNTALCQQEHTYNGGLTYNIRVRVPTRTYNEHTCMWWFDTKQPCIIETY